MSNNSKKEDHKEKKVQDPKEIEQIKQRKKEEKKMINESLKANPNPQRAEKKKKKPDTEEIPEKKEEINQTAVFESKNQVNELAKEQSCPNQHHSVLSHLRSYVEVSSSKLKAHDSGVKYNHLGVIFPVNKSFGKGNIE